eukprot:tig00020603_g11815.t1
MIARAEGVPSSQIFGTAYRSGSVVLDHRINSENATALLAVLASLSAERMSAAMGYEVLSLSHSTLEVATDVTDTPTVSVSPARVVVTNRNASAALVGAASSPFSAIVESYWRQRSGPAAVIPGSATVASRRLILPFGLTEGTYVFEFTARNAVNDEASASAVVEVDYRESVVDGRAAGSFVSATAAVVSVAAVAVGIAANIPTVAAGAAMSAFSAAVGSSTVAAGGGATVAASAVGAHIGGTAAGAGLGAAGVGGAGGASAVASAGAGAGAGGKGVQKEEEKTPAATPPELDAKGAETKERREGGGKVDRKDKGGDSDDESEHKKKARTKARRRPINAPNQAITERSEAAAASADDNGEDPSAAAGAAAANDGDVLAGELAIDHQPHFFMLSGPKQPPEVTVFDVHVPPSAAAAAEEGSPTSNSSGDALKSATPHVLIVAPEDDPNSKETDPAPQSSAPAPPRSLGVVRTLTRLSMLASIGKIAGDVVPSSSVSVSESLGWTLLQPAPPPWDERLKEVSEPGPVYVNGVREPPPQPPPGTPATASGRDVPPTVRELTTVLFWGSVLVLGLWALRGLAVLAFRNIRRLRARFGLKDKTDLPSVLQFPKLDVQAAIFVIPGLTFNAAAVAVSRHAAWTTAAAFLLILVPLSFLLCVAKESWRGFRAAGKDGVLPVCGFAVRTAWRLLKEVASRSERGDWVEKPKPVPSKLPDEDDAVSAQAPEPKRRRYPIEQFASLYDACAYDRLAYLGCVFDLAKTTACIALVTLLAVCGAHWLYLLLSQPFIDRFLNVTQALAGAAEICVFAMLAAVHGGVPKSRLEAPLVALSMAAAFLLLADQVKACFEAAQVRRPDRCTAGVLAARMSCSIKLMRKHR